jgi:hypothetical protein
MGTFNPPPVMGGPVLLPVGTVILGSAENSGPDANGQYVSGRTITFQLADGAVGTVWLPYAQINAANVVAAVTKVMAQIQAIYGTSNP